MPLLSPPASEVDGVTLQDSNGVISVIPSVPKTATGSSNSSTPGTAVASVIAAADHYLIGVVVMTNGGSSANTRVTLTLEDLTTVTADTAAANSLDVLTVGGKNATAWSAPVTQRVVGVAVTTLGAGTAARTASIAAYEVGGA